MMKRKIVNYGMILLFILLSISLLRGFLRLREANKKISEVAQEVSNLEAENNEISDNLEMASTQGFVEKQARDKLGLSREDEIVVVLPEPDILRKIAPSVPREENVLPDPTWMKWLKLFY